MQFQAHIEWEGVSERDKLIIYGWMCDTITQLSIYSLDRVKLTAMSVNLINDITDLTTIQTFFLTTYLFSGTIGTTERDIEY